MLQETLKDLEMLGAVQHSSLLQGEQILASTFPAILAEKLQASAKVIRQLMMAATAMEQGFQEVHIELQDHLLIGYPLDQQSLLLLMTGKEINFALLNTAIRAASPRLLSEIEKLESPMAAKEPEEVDADIPVVQPELVADELLVRIKGLLAEYVGPAASIVFERCRQQWLSQSDGHHAALPELVEMSAGYIEDITKRADFVQRVGLVKP